MLFTLHQSAKCNHIVNKVSPKTSETLTSFSKRPVELRLMAPLRLFILMMSIKESDAIKKSDLKFQSQGQFCMHFLYKSPPIHRCRITLWWFLRLPYRHPVHIRDNIPKCKSPILMKLMYNAVFSENSSQSCKLETYFTEYFGNYQI